MPSHPPLSTRDPAIDTLRAIACLALVSFHTVGNGPGTGLQLGPAHGLSVMNATLEDMRMPLFSFLSGFVFISLEGLTRSPAHVLLSKARRLLLPMVSVGLVFWLVRDTLGYDQKPMLHLFVLPFAHFWFLQATFLIMATFVLLHWLWNRPSPVLAALLMGLGGVMWCVGPRPSVNLFSVSMAFYLMPFFMLGYLCARTRLTTWMRTCLPRPMVLASLGVLGCIAYLLATGQIALTGVERRYATIAIGIPFCLALITLAPRHAGLARLGSFSYAIYLFHLFFTAGAREGMMYFAPQSPDMLVWLICLCAGILGPIGLSHLLMRNGWLAAVFLGLRFPGLVPRAAGVAQKGAAQRA